jgi:biotin synthase
MDKNEALKLAREEPLDRLMESAKALREKHFGKRIHLCGIVNAKSGRCSMDCKFCSQRCQSEANVPAYSFLSQENLQRRIDDILCHARRCSIVTSGGYLNGEDVDRLIQFLKSQSPRQVSRLCGSLGRLPREQLIALREAGLRRFCHNLETSQRFYPQLCTTQRWEDRFSTICLAKELGYEICAGGIFGVGETWEDRIDLAMAVGSVGVTCMPINFLHPHPGTPLAKMPLLGADEALRIVAILRHLLPKTSLRICGGRTDVLGDRQYEVFDAGASALMVGDYLTTKGESLKNDFSAMESMGLEF